MGTMSPSTMRLSLQRDWKKAGRLIGDCYDARRLW